MRRFPWVLLALTIACNSPERREPAATKTVSAAAPPAPEPAATSPKAPTALKPAAPAVGAEDDVLPMDLPPLEPAQAASGVAPSTTTHANAFSLRMLRRLTQGRENTVLAPVTGLLALNMLATGARAETAAELRNSLGLEPAQGKALAQDVQELVQAKGSAVHVTTGLYVQDAYTLVPAFQSAMASTYRAALRNLPFAANPDAARTQINADVSESTAGRVKELLPAGTVDPQTRVVLTSALAMLAEWAVAFDPAHTQKGPFTRADKQVVEVPFMLREGELPMGMLGDDTTVVELAYAGGQLVMDVVLPGSLEDPVTEAFDADALGRALERLEPARVRLSLPRFSAELTATSLKPLLMAQGVRRAFEPSADLSGIAGKPGDLYVKDVMHGAFIDVNEKGTEASGATAVVIAQRSAAPNAIPSVVVNRPFLFFIRKPSSGLILLAGRIGNPTTR